MEDVSFEYEKNYCNELCLEEVDVNYGKCTCGADDWTYVDNGRACARCTKFQYTDEYSDENVIIGYNDNGSTVMNITKITAPLAVELYNNMKDRYLTEEIIKQFAIGDEILQEIEHYFTINHSSVRKTTAEELMAIMMWFCCAQHENYITPNAMCNIVFGGMVTPAKFIDTFSKFGSIIAKGKSNITMSVRHHVILTMLILGIDVERYGDFVAAIGDRLDKDPMFGVSGEKKLLKPKTDEVKRGLSIAAHMAGILIITTSVEQYQDKKITAEVLASVCCCLKTSVVRAYRIVLKNYVMYNKVFLTHDIAVPTEWRTAMMQQRKR